MQIKEYGLRESPILRFPRLIEFYKCTYIFIMNTIHIKFTQAGLHFLSRIHIIGIFILIFLPTCNYRFNYYI